MAGADTVSLREHLDAWQHHHEDEHVAFLQAQDRLREAWRSDAMQWRASHDASHTMHMQAHEREHQLNQQAINKAETSVDRAVGAARETMEKQLDALSGRIEHAEDERLRALGDLKEEVHQFGLRLQTLTGIADTNAKNIHALQESQTWVVRLVAGAILLALLTLIFRPALLG